MNATALDYDLLASFVAVAEEGSFSKAARRLRVTKSTVSRALSRLERSVGAPLLHRNTHVVALSTTGAALYERCAPHFGALQAALRDLPEPGAEPSGLLRLTAPLDLGVSLLPELLARFSMRYADVRFDLRITNTPVDLLAEGIDLAIRASPRRLADSSLVARRIGHSTIGLYASPGYLARRGTPREIGDPKHDWVLFSHTASFLPKIATPRFVTDDFLNLRELLRQGVGVGLLSKYTAEPLLRTGELVQVMELPQPRTGGLFLVYPAGRTPPKVTAFRDFLLERWPRAST